MGSDEIAVAMERVGALRARPPRLAGLPPVAWRCLQAGAAPVAAATVAETRIHA